MKKILTEHEQGALTREHIRYLRTPRVKLTKFKELSSNEVLQLSGDQYLKTENANS